MKLDNSQPWMLNNTIKARILLANRAMTNPVMLAYQEEYKAMSLVPIPFSNVSRR